MVVLGDCSAGSTPRESPTSPVLSATTTAAEAAATAVTARPRRTRWARRCRATTAKWAAGARRPQSSSVDPPQPQVGAVVVDDGAPVLDELDEGILGELLGPCPVSHDVVDRPREAGELLEEERAEVGVELSRTAHGRTS